MTRPNPALLQIREERVSRSNDNSSCLFLDLEIADDSGSEQRSSSETRRQEAESALDSLLSEKTAVEMKSFVNKEGNRKAALSQESAMSAPWFVVEFTSFMEVMSVGVLG